MSNNFKLQSSSEDLEPKNDDVKDDKTNADNPVQHETGTIVKNSTNLVDDYILPNYNFSKMPINDISDYFSRNQQVYTQLFTGTTSVGNVFSIDVLNLWQTLTNVGNKLKNYSYMKANFVITAIIASPPGVYGLGILSAMPQGGGYNATLYAPIYTNTNINNATHVPHAFVDFSLANSVEIKVPFLATQDWVAVMQNPSTGQATTPTFASMYILNCFLYSPIQSALNTAEIACSMRIFVRAEDVQLAVPTYQSGKGNYKLSDVANDISNVANYVADKVPVISFLAKPISVAAQIGSSIAKLFGFTRNSMFPKPDVMKMLGHANITNVDCVDVSENAALSIKNSISIDPKISYNIHEHDPSVWSFQHEHWTWLDTIEWTNLAAGTILGHYGVNIFNTYSTSTNKFSLNPAAYNGLPFEFWRGDVEFMIYPIASKFHSGTLMVSFDSGSNLTGDPTPVNRNVIMDITTGQPHCFTIGYCSPKPCLRRCLNPNPDVLATFDANSSMGIMYLTVQNPLLASGGVGPDVNPVYLAIFMRAGKNMRFGSPSTIITTMSATGSYQYSYLNNISYQSGRIGDDPFKCIEHVLVPSPGDYPISEILWGEEVLSSRAMLQKPGRIKLAMQALVQKFALFFVWLIPHFHRPTTANDINHSSSNKLNNFSELAEYLPCVHYLLPFVGVAGSTIYRVKPLNMGGDGVVSVTRYPFYNLSTNYASIDPTDIFGCENYQQCSLSTTAEIKVPYYGCQLFELVNLVNHATADTAFFASSLPPFLIDVVRVGTNNSSSVPTQMNVFKSMGPDVRLTTYRGPPDVTLPNANTGSTTYWNTASGG